MLVWMKPIALLAQMPAPQGQEAAPPPVPLPHPEIIGPILLPARLEWWALLIIILLELAFVIGIIWILFRSTRSKDETVAFSPRAKALRALRRLSRHAPKLPPSSVGHRVSRLVRIYLFERYDIPAPFRTTIEIFGTAHLEQPHKVTWRSRFEHLPALYDRLEYAPLPTSSVDALDLVNHAIACLSEETDTTTRKSIQHDYMIMEKQNYVQVIRQQTAYPTYRSVIKIIENLLYCVISLGAIGGVITAIVLMMKGDPVFVALSVVALIITATIAGLGLAFVWFYKEASFILVDIADATIDKNSRPDDELAHAE